MYADAIERLRERLNAMMQIEFPNHHELLKLSTELDKYIVLYMKEKYPIVEQ